MKTMKKNLSYLLILVLIIIIFFLVKLLLQYAFFYQIKVFIVNIIFPFFISFSIVYIFHPVLYWFEKRFSIKTWVSTLILLITNSILIILLLEIVFPILNQQIINIIIELPKYLDKTDAFIVNLQTKHDLFNNKELINTIISYKDKITLKITDSLVSFTISTVVFSFKSLWVIIMIPLLVFIMMKDYSLIYDKLSQLLIHHRKSEWIQLLKNIDKTLGTFIRGQFIIMGYMFIGTFIPLALLGMPNAFVFSIIIAITNIIPYLGPLLSGVPLCIYAYFQSPYLFLSVIILLLFMQLFDRFMGQPYVYGSRFKMHSVVILIVMLIGSVLGGIIGLIVSVPIYIVFNEFFIFFIPVKKDNLEKNL